MCRKGSGNPTLTGAENSGSGSRCVASSPRRFLKIHSARPDLVSDILRQATTEEPDFHSTFRRYVKIVVV
ncbi:unnamed protein product [Pleuronectes platessa]|uniref:Uncharacterized protein n=1 Tax=Pleuronectes platessa TaxID=8262 RepID=A0A9N7Y740_PLEPL|nr:unnamed protein product [Pleuronectes platessa]